MQNIDYIVFLCYFIGVSAYGYWIYKRKQKAEQSTTDFFLAEGSLTWWAIGASLIASNISAEQFIGTSGSAFAMGLAIASWEWLAAATLIIVAVFFLPIYLKNKIYTMPQFLSQRYSPAVAGTMAVFWLLVFVFVNLTSILYLGALAVSTISGLSMGVCIAGFSIFAVFITLGGMKVIGYTDVVQVVVLIFGGLVTTYLALNLVSGGQGWAAGLSALTEKAPSHFHMILKPDNDYYKDLPGLSVLFGATWIANLYYWGCNQYITQRALGADLQTARSGLLFAAILKILMPIIVVLPGIAVYVLYKDGDSTFTQGMLDASGKIKPDNAYPLLINLLPAGLKGLSFAALTAAIVASLAGKANSIATIFSLDIYKKYINQHASDATVVRTGRITILVAMLIGALVAPMLKNFDQAFQFIQEFTGFLSPGAFAIFLLGFFWRRTNAPAALFAALSSIPLSFFMKSSYPDIPFLDRMGITFLIIVAVMVVLSLAIPRTGRERDVEVDSSMFRVSNTFAIYTVLILGMLAALYTIFW